MEWCASRFMAFFCLLSTLAWADERVYFASEDEKRWNTPPKLTPETIGGKSNLDNESLQPRFLPFSASFTLSAGGDANNAHSLSVGGSQDGISFSQSASQAGNSFGNEGSGISASQSSSFSAGLSGISAADANSFNLNHPTFGGNSQANSNSFALGQATSSAQGNVLNGQAISGAQSGVGSSHSSAGSSTGMLGSSQGQGHRYGRPTWTNVAPNYEVESSFYNPNSGHSKLHASQGHFQPSQRPFAMDYNWHQRRPEVLIRPHPGSWSQSQDSNKPGLQISGASASSSATSNSPGGSSFGQSSSHSNLGPNGPTSWTNNNVQTSGNAQSQAQGSAAVVGQNFHGSTQASFSSGAIAGGSQGNGYSQGSSTSGNRGQSSQGQVTNHATGTAFVQGTANSGSVSFVKFPGEETSQNIPKEFVRSRPSSNVRNGQQRRTSRTRDPVDAIISDFTDTVADLFDI